MTKHLLKDMSWREFAGRLAENPVILLPLGSQEEQGPMAPMGDFMLTERIADLVAERTGAIAAPTVPFGHADYFRPVPGGIALRAETFKALFEDLCVSFLEHGLTRLLVVNGHSGNFPLIDQAIRALKREHGVLIPCINLWRSIPDGLWQELHPDVGKAALGHGADPVTSAYMHLFPELVREDLIEAPDAQMGELLGLPTAGLDAVVFQGQTVNVALDVTERCSNGIAGGDPRRASAANGRRIVEHLVDFLSAFVAHLETVDPRVGRAPSR